MDATEKQLQLYRKEDGAIPFSSWMQEIKDRTTRLRIQARIDKVALGNLGSVNSVGQGVHELKIDIGPGFRVYFGNDGKQIILLLLGGDKSSQKKDIQTAQDYWQDFQDRKEHPND